MALGIGALALVARAYGSGDSVRARRLGAQAISVSLILAVLLTAVMIPLTRPFLTNMLRITDPVVIDQGTIYVQTILTTSFLALPAIAGCRTVVAIGLAQFAGASHSADGLYRIHRDCGDAGHRRDGGA